MRRCRLKICLYWSSRGTFVQSKHVSIILFIHVWLIVNVEANDRMYRICVCSVSEIFHTYPRQHDMQSKVVSRPALRSHSLLSPDPKRIGGYSDQPGVRPSVRPSVRP